MRDIIRKIADRLDLAEIFALPLSLARRVKDQRRGERGRKVYALHAPEVECIGKGKAHKRYEFGVKVSVATPLRRCKGGQFVAHVKALPGNPYDGHTLESVIPDIERTIGAELEQVITDAGYKGHKAPPEQALPGVRGRPEARSEQRDQARVPAPLGGRAGDRPSQGRPPHGPQPSRHSAGDAINAVLAAVGYNFRLLFLWISILCAWFSATIYRILRPSEILQPG